MAIPMMGFSQSTLNFPKLFSAAELPVTGFAIVNPNTATATVAYTLYAANGTTVSSSSKPISAGGQLALSGVQLFSTVGSGGWVQVTSAGGAVAATALIKGYLVTTDSGVINGVDRSSTVSEADFPHVINGALTGANYTTVIGVTNLSSTAQTVTITFTPTTGSATSV